MAEKSLLWTTGATGDGTTPYTQAETIQWRRQEMVGDNTDEGVQKYYQNGLAPTGAATPVQIDTGAAIVYGFPYWNTAANNIAVSTPSASTRVDRIVLQADWTAQTIRLVLLAGTEGVPTPPALTQTDGVTWEISICQVSITTGGVITLTDERVFLHPNIGVDEYMIDNAALGNGLKGGDGTALAVEPADIAGAGLEDDGADNLRIAAAAAGDGLQGGSGSALAVDVSDFAGAGLEDDGAENLRIAAAAAGNGLAGGAGSALSVNVDDASIEISADTLQVKALGIDTAELAADSVDDTKAGNRVPQMYRRQGGSATNWDTQGTTTYTPGAVRIQCGSIQLSTGGGSTAVVVVTFPTAFSQVPLVLVSCDDNRYIMQIQNPSATQVNLLGRHFTEATISVTFDAQWIAIGTE